MNNFIELNIKNSQTSLTSPDPDIKLINNVKFNVITTVKSCSVCGVPESIVKLYDGLCPDCAKHYKFDY